MARLALFALFAVALVLLRDALSARWRAGEERARAFLQDNPAEVPTASESAPEGAP